MDVTLPSFILFAEPGKVSGDCVARGSVCGCGCGCGCGCVGVCCSSVVGCLSDVVVDVEG